MRRPARRGAGGVDGCRSEHGQREERTTQAARRSTPGASSLSPAIRRWACRSPTRAAARAAQREHARTIGRCCPLRRRGHGSRIRESDADADEHLSSGDHGERRAQRARADPTATKTSPTASRSRRPKREARSPASSAVTPATRPEIVRSWPAVAVETSRSAAIDVRIGVRTSSAACEAARPSASVDRRRSTDRLHRMIGTVPPSALQAAPVT